MIPIDREAIDNLEEAMAIAEGLWARRSLGSTHPIVIELGKWLRKLQAKMKRAAGITGLASVDTHLLDG